MSKKSLHSKEQSDRARAKKDREMRGEIQKLKKENLRLRKEVTKRESYTPVEADDIAEEVKPEVNPHGVKCPNCTGLDLVEFQTSRQNQILLVCKSCKYKWSKVA